MSKSDEWLRRREAVVARGVPRVTRATVASARGATLVDADGREYIDFTGGIGVMNVGHCDEAVVEAIREQAGRLLHVCIHVATYEPYVQLCERLAALFPHGDATKVMLVNSGAEAVENSIKIARQATGRGSVICFSEAFHGRTLLCATLSSKVGYKKGCGPFAPEIYRLPYPNTFHAGQGVDPDEFARAELDRLRRAFGNTVDPKNVAAIIIELVQGEGGFCVAPAEYVRGLREICDEHGIVLIFDEVQTGFGRTGAWGAYQRFDVTPDLSTWAKSLGGGLPISAVVGRAHIIDAAVPGTLGGTYGGNPVACAAALAAIERMEALRLNDRAVEIGVEIRRRFRALQKRVPAAADARGLGAMMAIELCEGGDRRRPATETVRRIIDACVERGLLVISAGLDGNVIRVLAPLVITDDELERGLDILEEEIVRHTADTGGASATGGDAASLTGRTSKVSSS